MGTLKSSLPDAKPVVLCFTPFGNDWTWFVEELTAPNVRWIYLSDRVDRGWKRLFGKPNVFLLLTTLSSVMTARRVNAKLMISHDPRATAWIGFWSSLLGSKTEHIAFSFNLPEMPRGLKAKFFRHALKSVSFLRVHSSFEIDLYKNFFQLPKERFRLGLWCMNTPEVEPSRPLFPGDYLCAVGGNARDYGTLLEASRRLPEIPMVWVVRPENIVGMDIPAHIQIVENVRYQEAMNVLKFSRGMVLPLRDSEVPCGHVTIVSAMYLSKAILVTDSAGIRDYVKEGENGILCRPGDPEDMAYGMQTLWSDRDLAERLGMAGCGIAEEFCSMRLVSEEFTAMFAERGIGRLAVPLQNDPL